MTDPRPRIALITDLREAVGPDSRSELATATFELVQAVQAWATTTRSAVVDLVARRGSWRGLPLVSIDPDELGELPAHPGAWPSAQEALYTRLWAFDMLTGYDVVHCLAPVVAPVHLTTLGGTPVVQTVLSSVSDPSSWLIRRLTPPGLLRQVATTPAVGRAAELPVVRVPVDASRFPLTERGSVLLTDGTGDDGTAVALGEQLGRPVIRLGTDPADSLRQAWLLLHLAPSPSPCGAPWALRATACGLPVAGWDSGLGAVLPEPGIAALAPAGDVAALAAAIEALPDGPEVARQRRELVLALHSPSASMARYRAIYQELLRGRAGSTGDADI